VISLIGEVIKQGVDFFSDKQKAKHAVEIAVLDNAKRLAASKTSHNQEWEVHQLRNGDKWLRRISFTLFALPLLITVIKPAAGAQIFINLESAPDWYVQTFISINGAVWAIVELKHAAPQFVSGIKSVFGKAK